MNIVARTNRDKTKLFYYVEWGRGAGERRSLEIFSYCRPQSQIEKKHNKEVSKLIAVRKSELILEQQSAGSAFIPQHKFKANFLDYYQDYVNKNRKAGNRHLENSFIQFKRFLKKDFVSVIDVTDELGTRFRKFLLDNFGGETPASYFSKFKKMIKAATKEGYFRVNPAQDVKSKSNPAKFLKENLEVEEYVRLLKTPCLNEEVREAFIFCCYTALRWCDVKPLCWEDIKGEQLKTRVVQAKTGQPVWITLHPIAKAILLKRKAKFNAGALTGKVFHLPSHDGANKLLGAWCRKAGIDKHITWHCARLSFSILLQDANVDNSTVALLLGHSSTQYVERTYKRHRPKDEFAAISRLPSTDSIFLPGIDKDILNN